MEVWLPVATKSQTCQEGVGAKRKEIYSGAAQPGRMVDSHLKHHLPPPAQPQSSYRERRQRVFFLVQLFF